MTTLTAAVAEFLPAPLAALLTSDQQRADVLAVREVIGCDDLARAWLIGMNPMLDEQSPVRVIAASRGAAVIRAAKEMP